MTETVEQAVERFMDELDHDIQGEMERMITMYGVPKLKTFFLNNDSPTTLYLCTPRYHNIDIRMLSRARDVLKTDCTLIKNVVTLWTHRVTKTLSEKRKDTWYKTVTQSVNDALGTIKANDQLIGITVPRYVAMSLLCGLDESASLPTDGIVKMEYIDFIPSLIVFVTLCHLFYPKATPIVEKETTA